MKPSTPIPLRDSVTLPPGTRPIVVVGANGSGKSMLGVQFVKDGAKRISARRSLDVPGSLTDRSLTVARQQREKNWGETSVQRTQLATDLELLLGELNAEDAERGRVVRKALIQNENHKFDRATLLSQIDVVQAIWQDLFPGRVLKFEDSKPQVSATHRGESVVYRQNDMSDGERQGLYLIAKVVIMPTDSVIVVDEPETNLHPLLARRLWSRLEDLKSECRFVYITHDIPFAMSRHPSHFVVCRANGQHEIVTKLADDFVSDLVGAVALPFGGSRVVFCEGREGSLDLGVFDEWFKGTDSSVIPLGGCEDVRLCVKGISKVPAHPGTVLGIVDRDTRSDDELAQLGRDGLFVLPLAEIEAVYAHPDVLRVIMRHLGFADPEETKTKLAELEEAMRTELSKHMHSYASARARDRVRWRLTFPLAGLPTSRDASAARATLLQALEKVTTAFDIGAMFDEELATLSSALAGSIEQMLKYFPNKCVLGLAARMLKTSEDGLSRLVRSGLRGDLGNTVKENLFKALEAVLPAR